MMGNTPPPGTKPPLDAAVVFQDTVYSVPPNRVIVDNLNLTINPGETLVLLGRSGSGKTTALKLINRLLSETRGAVWVEGRRTREWDLIALRRRIGYVIQESGLFPHYTIARNVGLVPRLLGMAAAKVAARVDEMLRLVDLDPSHFRERYPHQLSGGQRQRVGVARALAGDPPIILMDEPFGALDPLSRAELQGQFKNLQQQLQKTVILVTHDLPEALLLGTRIALLDSGRLIGTFSAAQFLISADPTAQAYVAAFRTGEELLSVKRNGGASHGEPRAGSSGPSVRGEAG